MLKMKSKAKTKIISVATALVIASSILAAGLYITSGAASGGSSDPLITLSYVNEVLKPAVIKSASAAVTQEIEALSGALESAKQSYESSMSELDALKKELETVKAGYEEAKQAYDAAAETVDSVTEELENLKKQLEDAKSLSVYTVLELKKGQKIMAKGAVEVVHRAGSCVAISPFSDQGVADMTSSKELYDGDELVKNDICLIPRGNDGRGVLVVSDLAYIMVRGEYVVE